MRFASFLLISMLLMCGFGSFAQSTVKGTFQYVDKKPLRKMKIALLHVGDSVQVQSTKTDREGKFEFDEVPTGDYILKYEIKKEGVNYIDFDFVGPIADFGIIIIEKKK